MTVKSEAGKKYRAKTRIGESSRYAGHACSLHPDEKGVRFIANGRCVGCHRVKMIAKRARKRLESEAFRATERAKQAERLARPGYKEVRLVYRRLPEVLARRSAYRKSYMTRPEVASKCAESRRLRAARRIEARPAWADQIKILEMYKEARREGLTVDHIVPLRGVEVCGLHVHYNLRLITRSENSAKGNRMGAF